MAWELVLAHILLPSAVAVAAGLGAWRCWQLLRYGRDPRLQNLAWFYGLFAASLVAMAIWMGRVAATVGDAPLAGFHVAFAGAERVDLFLLLHHVLMLASLSVAVRAFGQTRAQVSPAAAGLAVLGPFIPVILAVEAALTLYLAVQAFLNHRARRSPGALQVATGFLLFFLGHMSFLVFYHPGVARTPLGDVLALIGVILLVRLLPRPAQ